MSGAVVGVRAAGTKGSYGGYDDVGIGRQQGTGVQPDGGGVGGGVVMHHQINAADQPTEQILAGGVMRIEGYALLAGVQVEIQAAALRVGDVVGERAAAAGRVAAGRRFGLDDLRAQGGQELAAVGAGD